MAQRSASLGAQRLAFTAPPSNPLKIWLFLEKNSTPYSRLERLAADVTTIIYSLPSGSVTELRSLAVSPSLHMKCCSFSHCDAARRRVCAASSSSRLIVRVRWLLLKFDPFTETRLGGNSPTPGRSGAVFLSVCGGVFNHGLKVRPACRSGAIKFRKYLQILRLLSPLKSPQG